jgi:hypothetical protein
MVVRWVPANENGQASVAFIATLPALIALCAVLVQVAAVGWSAWSAAGAARAAARAELVGEDAERAAEAALPGPLADRAEVDRAGEKMRVEVTAPRLLPLLPAIEVGATAGLDPLPTATAATGGGA